MSAAEATVAAVAMLDPLTAEKTALTQVHFEVWLAMWEETVRGLFAGDKAGLAIQRAKDIGRLMLFKIEQRR